jgi:cellulose synthase/poly-beta-1,6-N-acetylglucosamine synthase-like glycosyltransferase
VKQEDNARVTAAPRIAVLIPNRNDSRYLRRCIQSILSQDVQPDEIVIVDDQSTDDSVAVIRNLIRTEPRASLIENPENLGPNGAINEGLKRIQSEYVLFLAANDFVLPGIFARAKACLANHPTAALWSAMVWLVDENDQVVRLHPSPVVALRDTFFSAEQCIRLARRHSNWFTGPTMVYHRETLIASGGFDHEYKGLSDLLTALVITGRKGAVYSPEPYAVIRVHEDSFLSRTLGDPAWVETMLARIAEHGPKLEPRLFTPSFMHRFALRMRFAAVRAGGGEGMRAVAASIGGRRRKALLLVDEFLPAGFRIGRVALPFMILRPFDILPTLLNRVFGAAMILLRVRLRGGNVIPNLE